MQQRDFCSQMLHGHFYYLSFKTSVLGQYYGGVSRKVGQDNYPLRTEGEAMEWGGPRMSPGGFNQQKKDLSSKGFRSGYGLSSLCLVSHLGNEDKIAHTTALELLHVPPCSPFHRTWTFFHITVSPGTTLLHFFSADINTETQFLRSLTHGLLFQKDRWILSLIPHLLYRVRLTSASLRIKYLRSNLRG